MADGDVTGDNNCCYGDNAGREMTTGSENSFYGAQSGYNITTGANNVAVGRNAGYDLTGGGNNVLIGLSAGRSSSPSGTLATASNKVVSACPVKKFLIFSNSAIRLPNSPTGLRSK